MNVLDFFTTLAGIVEGISLDQALRIMEAVNDHDDRPFDYAGASLNERVAKARLMPQVMENLTSPRVNKIMAIKEFRAASGLGLKESKDVIDVLAPYRPAPEVRYESPCGDSSCCPPVPVYS